VRIFIVVKIWTIGHSTRPLPEFLAVLAKYEVQAIADVRRHPGSRRQPQFGHDALEKSLVAHGLAYQWMPKLGGRRRARPDSPNTAWRNASFRGYADHIESEEFAEGLNELLEFAERGHMALMCAELLWWRCHRALIADVLCVRGIEVVHILDETKVTAHPYTSAARIVHGRLTYAATGMTPG
jgi:uncharacterized protein (DUF488 family)